MIRLLKNIYKVLNKFDKNDPYSTKMYIFLRLLVIPFMEIDSYLPKRGLILDAGCGNGPLSACLAVYSGQRVVVGWDINRSRLEDARRAEKKLNNIRFENKDVLRAPMPRLMGAVASDFLHHIPFSDHKNLIKIIYEHLEKNGTFILKEVDKSNFFRHIGSYFFDKLFYPRETICFRTKKEWVKILKGEGFEVTAKNTLSWFPASTVLFICRKQSEN